MTNIEAVRQLAKGLMCSDVWNELSMADKVAIRKAITALKNVSYGYQLHEIDNGMPIRYFTKGDIEGHKSPFNDGFYVMVDGRIVFSAITSGEHCRGLRGEMIVYDNSVDKKEVDEILAPLLRDNALLIHDAFDEEEWRQIDKERKEKMKKEG